MAVTLPAIVVTDDQFELLKQIFPGTSNAEKAAAYIALVRGVLREKVIEHTVAVAAAAQRAELEAIRVSAETDPNLL